MSESTLSVARDDVLREIGRFLGYSRSPGDWTENQSLDAADIIKRGLRQLYYPPVLDGDSVTHTWGFLRPIYTFSTIQGQADYDLPGGFGGFVSDLYYADDLAGGVKISRTSPEIILALRQAEQASLGYPSSFAVMPIATGGVTPQVWTMMLHPTPDGAWRFRGRYRINPDTLSQLAQYPVGGVPIADALVASVIAAADEMLNDQPLGVAYQNFLVKLRSAIAHDRQHYYAGNLGYNSDGNQESMFDRDDLGVTINGASYTFDGYYFDP